MFTIVQHFVYCAYILVKIDKDIIVEIEHIYELSSNSSLLFSYT